MATGTRKRITFDAKGLIFSEGEMGNCAYIIEAGEVEVFRYNKENSKVKIATLGPGAIFGEMALIDDKPRSANVMAVSETRCIIIDHTSFRQRIDSMDGFSSALMRTFIERLRQMSDVLTDMSKQVDNDSNKKINEVTRSVLIAEEKQKYSFEEVNFLLSETNRQIKQSLKGGFHHHGFREIRDVSTAQDMRDAAGEGSYDLMVLDTEMSVPDVCDIIHKVRHGTIGTNPFAIIICMIPEMEPALLQKIMDVGCDDIVIKPVSIANLIERIDRFVRLRKPFVVTTDYIGPDRRKNLRPGAEQIPQIHVPNPLKAKVANHIDPKSLQMEIEAAASMLNDRKVERHVIQIAWLSEKINITKQDGLPLVEFLDRLVFVSTDLVRRMQTSRYKNMTDQCKPLIDLSRKMRINHNNLDEIDQKHLSQIATAIKSAFDPDTIAREVQKAQQEMSKFIFEDQPTGEGSTED